MQNRNWKQWLVLAALASTPGLVACGGSDDPTPGDTGTDTDVIDDSGDTTPDAEPDTTPDAEPDTTPDAEPDAEPDTTPDADVTPDTVEPPVDACQNAADQTVLETVDVTGEAQTCGLGCLGDADPGACAGACVAEETGLSEDCAGCYSGIVVCSIDNCLAACASDPSSEACTSCQAENCLADFYTCTGEEPPPPTDACLNEDDQAILDTVDVTGEAQTCGLGCLGDADPGACAGACVAEETGLSADCAGCYSGIVVCSIDNCLAACASDPSSEACTTCQAENCLEDFYACTGTEEPEPNTIIDVATDAGTFTTLLTAIETAEMTEALRGEGPFTVFAPTDTAFEAIPEETLNALLADTDELTKVLNYHVLAGNFLAADLEADAGYWTTAANLSFFLQFSDETDTVNTVVISATDIQADNGVIHVIDAVLLPANIPSLISYNPDLSTLFSAVGVASLETALQDPDLTVFAPTNEAFDALAAGVLDDLLADIPALSDVLTYHVFEGVLDSAAVTAAVGTDVTMLNGDTAAVTNDPALAIDGASVQEADIRATNGIIHILNDVMTPPDAT